MTPWHFPIRKANTWDSMSTFRGASGTTTGICEFYFWVEKNLSRNFKEKPLDQQKMNYQRCQAYKKFFRKGSISWTWLNFDERFPIWHENIQIFSRSPEYLVNRKRYELASESEREQMLKDKTSTATRNIILIRHGQYHINSPDRFLTQLGGFINLSRRLQTLIKLLYKSILKTCGKRRCFQKKVSGREQAELVGKRLATSGIKFDEVVMSTMNRATETAKIILQQLPKEQKS